MARQNNEMGEPKKRHKLSKTFYRRMLFGLVAVVLSLGLLGSSLAGLTNIFSDNTDDYVQQQQQQTSAEIEASLESNPNDISLLEQLGQAYMREGNASKAVETFQRAVDFAPGREDLKNRLAESYLMLGNYDEAVNLLEKVLTDNPNNIDAHYNYGHALVGLGEYKKAQKEFEQYIALNGENSLGTEEAKRLVETLKGLQ